MIILKKFLKNSFWLSLATLSPTIAGFVLTPIYTRTLSPAEYGNTDLINILVTLLIPILTLQIADSLQTYLLKNKYEKGVLLTNSVFVAIIGFCISLILYPFFEIFFDQYTIYIFGLLLINSVKSIFIAYSHGINKVRYITISSLFETIILTALVFYFMLFQKLGIHGYFYAIIISRFSSFLVLIFFLKFWRVININLISKVILKSLIIFSIPLIPNMIGWWINNVSDRYLIAFFTNIENTGIYAVSMKLPGIVLILNNVLVSSWRITALENFNEKRSKLFKNFHEYYLSAIIIILILVNLFNEYFFSLYVGDESYMSGKEIVPILILAMLFSALASFYGVIYLGQENTKGVGSTTVIGAILNIILNLLLIPSFGITGAAIATLVSLLFVFLIRLKYVKKHTSIELSIFNVITIFTVILTTFIFKFEYISLVVYSILVLAVLIIIIYRSYKNGLTLLLNKNK